MPEHRVWWTDHDLPTGPLVVWRGDQRVGVREVRYVPAAEVERLEDALLGYFAGGYPVGTCSSRAEAELTIKVAAMRARARTT